MAKSQIYFLIFLISFQSCYGRGLKQRAICEPHFTADKPCDISSEGYGIGSDKPFNCVYKIETALNTITKLSFADFSIDNSASIKIFDGPDETSLIIGSLTNSTSHLFDYVTTGPAITVLYQSSATTNRGFKIVCERIANTININPLANGELQSNAQFNLANSVYHSFAINYDLHLPQDAEVNSVNLTDLSYYTKDSSPACASDAIQISSVPSSSYYSLCGNHTTTTNEILSFTPASSSESISLVRIALNLTSFNFETNQNNQFVLFRYAFYKAVITTTQTVTSTSSTTTSAIQTSTTGKITATTTTGVPLSSVTTASTIPVTSTSILTNTASVSTVTASNPTVSMSTLTTPKGSSYRVTVSNGFWTGTLLNVFLDGKQVVSSLPIGSSDHFQAREGQTVLIIVLAGSGTCAQKVPNHDVTYKVTGSVSSITCTPT